MIDTMTLGDFDVRGRYLPAALARLDPDALLGHAEDSALRNFQDPCTGRVPDHEQLEIIDLAARAERGGSIDPEAIPGMGLWDAAWEVLEDCEGLSYITAGGIEWTIRRNVNGDIVLVDETAAKAVQHNTAWLCHDCRELIYCRELICDGEGDADQKQRRQETLDTLGIEDDRDLVELDEADEQWIGRVEEAGALAEDFCDACDCFAPLKAYVRRPAFERDYAELAAENIRPPAEHGREIPHFD